MKKWVLDLAVCPDCLPLENKLFCHIKESDREEILSGTLQCRNCNSRFSIEEGIADLRPEMGQKNAPSKYEEAPVVTSYLWAHYADLFQDPDANRAYDEWGSLIQESSGISLDAGCAVGRFTFEMSGKCAFSLGVDYSPVFIRAARRLMNDRCLKWAFPDEGHLVRERVIRLPEHWHCEKVEFLVADIQALPFRSGIFSSLSSLNLVDKVPFPLKHLREINRVATESDAQLLFSDPFSWASGIAEEIHWLGGRTEGPYAGKGFDNVMSLLDGKRAGLNPAWDIEKQGHIWWKLRNHANHFELIRSLFIKACRSRSDAGMKG